MYKKKIGSENGFKGNCVLKLGIVIMNLHAYFYDIIERKINLNVLYVVIFSPLLVEGAVEFF